MAHFAKPDDYSNIIVSRMIDNKNDLPIFMRKYGSNNMTDVLHTHDSIQINYVMHGSLEHIVNNNTYDLVKGENIIKVPVKSWTGYLNEYTITVNADYACKLYVNTTGTFPDGTTPTPTVKKGDTNGDGEITLRDLANIRLHLLKLSVLEGKNLKGADTDGDGSVALRDLANLRLHLLGLKLLS